MKLRAAFLFLVLTALPSAALCAQRIIPPNSMMTVKLLAPLSTKTNKAGDKISAQVVAPTAFQGDFVGGTVREVKNGGKIHGKSVLNFTFDTLYHHGKAIPIASNVVSLMNSHGQENVDEEGEVVKKKNNIPKIGLATAGGGLLGGILGGWKGAAIGAAVGLAASAVLVETMAKGPSIEFAPGSEFVLSVKQRRGKVESAASPLPPAPPGGTTSSTATQSPAANSASELAVTSTAECTGPGTRAVSNNTHGTIQIQGGTGSFAGLSPTEKVISVAPGTSINGTVQLSVVNQGASFAVAPLIWTSSWGDPANSWSLIQGWVHDGQNNFTVPIQVKAPQASGTYHIVFAFQLETNGVNVASATNWAKGQPVWNDGNDVAEFSAQQIAEAQQFGCTTDRWLMQTGSQWLFIPADAITINVGSNGGTAKVNGRATIGLSAVYSFPSSPGPTGFGPLLLGKDGDLYGAYGSSYPANFGLSRGCVTFRGFCGEVYRMTPQGQFTVLHVFSLGADGGLPSSGLVQGSNGTLYGTAPSGGDFNCGGGGGCGTVFEINSAGVFKVLRAFSGSDGSGPTGTLAGPIHGYLYGATARGGASSHCPEGCGVIYKMDLSGNVTVLHSFTGINGGAPGNVTLLYARDGNLYGTTSSGGASNKGTIFRMGMTGNLTVLHSFSGRDGYAPSGGLTQGTDGYLYGMALGGAFGKGVIFRISTSGNYTLLYSFSGPDGDGPVGQLIQARDGYFYGATQGQGGCTISSDGGCGSVFRMDQQGHVTVLYAFTAAKSDGAFPQTGLVGGKGGVLYGTASEGGSAGSGVIFELPLPASPTAAITQPLQSPQTEPAGAQQPTAIVRALVRDGQTSIELPSGRFYIYGMATGGGAQSSAFAVQPPSRGPFLWKGKNIYGVTDAAGMLSAAISYGTNPTNNFATTTGYYVIGGASLNGSWSALKEYYGANRAVGASGASFGPFLLHTSALAVVVGLASNQHSVSFQGIPGLTVDAASSEPGAAMVIAHAFLSAGNYHVVERSAVPAGGQDPSHMCDLVAVFVFEK